MKNSNARGKRGEREIVNILKDYGLTARRTAQYCGKSGDAADVAVEELKGVHWEVKYVEKLNIWDAIDQAVRDCGERTPIVAHRKNGKPWVVTMFLEDYLRLAVPKPNGAPSFEPFELLGPAPVDPALNPMFPTGSEE